MVAGGREQCEGAERSCGCAAVPGGHPGCGAERAGAPVPEAREADAVEARPWQVRQSSQIPFEDSQMACVVIRGMGFDSRRHRDVTRSSRAA